MSKLSEYVGSILSERDRSQERTDRINKLKAACARNLVLYGKKKMFDPDSVFKVADRDIHVPIDQVLEKVCGSLQGVVDLVKSGLAGQFDPPWTPAFVHGLIDSGAMTPAGNRGSFYIERGRLGLISSFPSLGVSGRISKEVQGSGRHLVVDFWLPYAPDEPDGEPRRLAGVAAGCRPTVSCGRSWLAYSPKRVDVLRKYGIAFRVGERYVRRMHVGKNLLVSPFYAGAMSDLMPEGLTKEALSFKSPGDCPLMPWCYFKMAVAERRRLLCDPCVEVLPYCGGREAWLGEGWSFHLLGRAALEEFDIGWVHPCLGGELRRRFHRCDSCSRRVEKGGRE